MPIGRCERGQLKMLWPDQRLETNTISLLGRGGEIVEVMIYRLKFIFI